MTEKKTFSLKQVPLQPFAYVGINLHKVWAGTISTKIKTRLYNTRTIGTAQVRVA